MSRSFGSTSFTTRSPMRDRAVGRVLEPGDHPQRGRLAAARRPEQHEELLVGDVEGQVVDGDDVAEPLRDVLERDPSHGGSPSAVSVSSRRRSFFGGRQNASEEQRRATDADDRGDEQAPSSGRTGTTMSTASSSDHLPGPERAERDREHGDAHDVLVALLRAAEEEAVLEVVGEERDEHQRAHPAVHERGEEPEHQPDGDDQLGDGDQLARGAGRASDRGSRTSSPCPAPTGSTSRAASRGRRS